MIHVVKLYSWLIIKPYSFRFNLSLSIRFDAMETLESYQLTKSDYYTHAWDLPPQLGGCVPEAGSLPFQSAINVSFFVYLFVCLFVC